MPRRMAIILENIKMSFAALFKAPFKNDCAESQRASENSVMKCPLASEKFEKSARRRAAKVLANAHHRASLITSSAQSHAAAAASSTWHSEVGSHMGKWQPLIWPCSRVFIRSEFSRGRKISIMKSAEESAGIISQKSKKTAQHELYNIGSVLSKLTGAAKRQGL